MTRSRRLALAAAVVVLGLSACGDPNTTAPLADGPKVIQLASGQSGQGVGGSPEAAPAAATMDAAADSKMAYFGPTEFVYDGELPALDAPAGSWYFPTGQQPDLDRVAQLAAALGAEGEVRALPEDQGGGWAVGPEDYSGTVLTVGSDGMLSWWLSAMPTTPVAACGVGVAPAVEPATEPDIQISSGNAADAPASTSAPAMGDVVSVTPLSGAPDLAIPECDTPEPPVGVPTKDEALATAKQLFADWGYDVDSYQFDEPYSDEWGASVNASLMLDGMTTPIMLSVGFGENGAVTYASGSLAEPVRGDDYPTIGTAAGLERLKTQQNQYIGLDSVSARSATDDASIGSATEVASTVGTASDNGGMTEPAIAPDVAPCEPEAARADCAPIPPSEPVTVTLNSVKADLMMQWAADDVIWLLPAYTFGSADGGRYSVLAVGDAYIQEVDPAIAVSEPAVTEMPVPDTVAPVPADDTVTSATAVG